MSRSLQPFYDPAESYQENYEQGPFGLFADGKTFARSGAPKHTFLGTPIYLPFGIPAGPLLNAKFVTAAFRAGFDICTYKTVRTRPYPCHPWPNVLAVHPTGKLEADRTEPLVADEHYDEPVSITNSFGVPSANPDVWQGDMQKALKSAGTGQVMIGSFQGTSDGSGSIEQYIADFVTAAKLVAETGAQILEANLSCPNEGSAHLLCFDIERTALIAAQIKEAIGNTPLILKIAYFAQQSALEKFVRTLAPIVDAFAAINTIPAAIVTANGTQALPGQGRLRSGVCGAAIQWAGLEMTERLVALRQKLKMQYTVIGVGGVTTAQDYERYRQAGADAVQSATGAMWHPDLAQQVWKQQKEQV